MSNFSTKHNRVVWFDIPVADLDRSIKFYAEVLNIEVGKEDYEGMAFAILDHDEGNGGCLVPNAKEVTSNSGPLMYLNVDGRIRDAISKVSENGGEVTQEIHQIGPHGFRALINDSEGNRIALHSETDA